jgi:protein required for attachment to host cells
MKKRACIAVVDAAHAQIYSYSKIDGEPATLVAELDLVNPGRREHGMFTDQPSRGPHGFGTKDDHRTDHVEELDARFARQIVGELERLSRDRAFKNMIVVASASMLGLLRAETPALSRTGVEIDEVPYDLAKLTPPQLHDRLAALSLIAPRSHGTARTANLH